MLTYMCVPVNACVCVCVCVCVGGALLDSSGPTDRSTNPGLSSSTPNLGGLGIGDVCDLTPTVLVPVEKLASSAQRLVDLAGMLGTIKSDTEYAAFRTAQVWGHGHTHTHTNAHTDTQTHTHTHTHTCLSRRCVCKGR